MMRVLIKTFEQLVELFISCLLLLFYGFQIFGSSVVQDLSQSLLDNTNVEAEEEMLKGETHHHDLPPVVFVQGFYGFGSFGKRKLGALSKFVGTKYKNQRVLAPDFGSLSSIHDRARELFYYLKGGQVDYGEEHSKACGHSQFGPIYERGEYPEWDEDHPVHFLGHSAGAQVVRLLQQMLANKAFKGYENSSENWVLSITSLSGVINGTTRAYIDGIQVEDGIKLKPDCMLQLWRTGVTIYEWLDIWWLKKHYKNLGLDHFKMSWRKTGIRGLIDCLIKGNINNNVGPFASGDWILPDLTIQGSIRLNKNIDTFSNTYYFSYATKRSCKIMGVTMHSWVRRIHPLLFLRVMQMRQWQWQCHDETPYKGYRNEDWEENDGEVNTISMTHPRFPIEHPSCLMEQDSSHCQSLQPGIWYYKVVEGDHIAFIVNRERKGGSFESIYHSIFERCRKLACV